MASKKPAGVMRLALMRRMTPPEMDMTGEEGFPTDTNAKPVGDIKMNRKGEINQPEPEEAGAVEASVEGSATDALNELGKVVDTLPQDKQAEANRLLDQLSKLFEEKETPAEGEPDETTQGPSTGNSTLGEY